MHVLIRFDWKGQQKLNGDLDLVAHHQEGAHLRENRIENLSEDPNHQVILAQVAEPAHNRR